MGIETCLTLKHTRDRWPYYATFPGKYDMVNFQQIAYIVTARNNPQNCLGDKNGVVYSFVNYR